MLENDENMRFYIFYIIFLIKKLSEKKKKTTFLDLEQVKRLHRIAWVWKLAPFVCTNGVPMFNEELLFNLESKIAE